MGALESTSVADLLVRLEELFKEPNRADRAEVLAAAEALFDLPAEAASTTLVECLIMLAKVHYLTQAGQQMVRPASEAVRHAEGIGDLGLLRRACSVAGVAFMWGGDLASSLEHNVRAMSIARQLGDPAAQAPALVNISALLMSNGLHEQAIPLLERTIDFAIGAGDEAPMLLTQVWTNLAACFAEIGDAKRGLQAALKALAVELTTDNAHRREARTLDHTCMVRLLLQRGEVNRANEHLQAAAALVEPGASAIANSSLEEARALLDVHAGRVEQGLTALERLLAQHKQQGRTPGITSNLEACVVAYEAAGRPDAALRHLRELFAIAQKAQTAELRQRLEAVEVAHADSTLGARRVALEEQVRAKDAVLLDTAVRVALATGHEARRPFRVGKLAEIFALHLSAEVDPSVLKTAGQLCDIGMLAVSRSIVYKRGPLTEQERLLLDEHVRHGAQLVEQTGLEHHVAAVDLLRLHHEKWDGSGPFGLKGEEISPGARILALVDAFETLTHKRPWPPPVPTSVALREIESNSKGHFDPALSKAFCRFVRNEYWEHDDFDDFLGSDGETSPFVKAQEQIARYAVNDEPE